MLGTSQKSVVFALASGLGAVLLGAGSGCESSGSAIRNVDVIYRFDNVRKSAALDEWPEVRAILAKHSSAVNASVDVVRSAGPVEVRAYKAIVNVPNVRAIDDIQRDLEQLAARRVGADRIHFTLTTLSADYRSNILTAGSQTTVSGYASPGYGVRVYPFEGAAPLTTVAGSDGRWTQSLSMLPQTRWVYASVHDPKKALPDSFYRINVSTQQQEMVDAATFSRLFPAGVVPAKMPPGVVNVAAAPPARPIAAANNELPTDSELVKARSAEDERVRLMREREAEGRRKRRELEERIDQRLRDAAARERAGR